MKCLHDQLAGGDKRSIGASNQVVAQLLSDPSALPELVQTLFDHDAVVRMRAADALEKVSAHRPRLLQPYLRQLFRLAASNENAQRWHAAQILPRLVLSKRQRLAAVELMLSYLHDSSSIVRTFAMQALADFACQDATLHALARRHIAAHTRTGSAAMRSRGKKLLARLCAAAHD